MEYLFLCYGFLFASVVCLWVPCCKKIPLWFITFIIAIVFGLISHVLEPLALISIAVFFIAAYYTQENKTKLLLRIIFGIIVLFLGGALSMHVVPGFHNLNIVRNVYLSKDAMPFTLYLNFDSAVVGLAILGYGHTLIQHWHEWITVIKKIILPTALIIFIVIVLALILNVVRWEPKFPQYFAIWAITNLLITCVKEEAFFRGFIQKYLSKFFYKVKFGNYLALLITAILFGLLHFRSGVGFVVLATVAGIGYGWIYLRTQRIEASILAHFSLNLIHILFFTYPGLSNAT